MSSLPIYFDERLRSLIDGKKFKSKRCEEIAFRFARKSLASRLDVATDDFNRQNIGSIETEKVAPSEVLGMMITAADYADMIWRRNQALVQDMLENSANEGVSVACSIEHEFYSVSDAYNEDCNDEKPFASFWLVVANTLERLGLLKPFLYLLVAVLLYALGVLTPEQFFNFPNLFNEDGWGHELPNPHQ